MNNINNNSDNSYPSTPYFQNGYQTTSPNNNQVLLGADFTLKPKNVIQPHVSMSPINLAQPQGNMSPINLGIGNVITNPSFMLNPDDSGNTSSLSPYKRVSKKGVQPTSISFCSNASGNSDPNETGETFLHMDSSKSKIMNSILGININSRKYSNANNLEKENINKIQESEHSDNVESSSDDQDKDDINNSTYCNVINPEKENRNLTIQMVKALMDVYNGDKAKIVKDYNIGENIASELKADTEKGAGEQMLTFRNGEGNKEGKDSISFPVKKGTDNGFPVDYIFNAKEIEDEKDEATKILCFLTIPRIVCRNGILQLMLISPILKQQVNKANRDNFCLSFKNVETLQTLEKLQVNLLTSCFQKSINSFGIQFINKTTYTKNTYSIFTRHPDECKKYVEGLNYLLRYQ